MKILACIAAAGLGIALTAWPAGAFAQQTKTDSSPAASTTSPTTAPAAKTTKRKAGSSKSTGKLSAGRQAAIARQRACGAEWKADKEAGKIAAGMKWPKYWSDCNKRKKAAGM